MDKSHPEPWKDIAEKAKRRLEAKLFSGEWQSLRFHLKDGDALPRNVLPVIQSHELLSSREIEITEIEDATTLLGKIHSQEWSAEEVTRAFCNRALIAHQLVNCVMDADLDAAIQRARELDTHLKTTGKLVGPLHGLPISIKDLTSVKGFHYSMGYVSWADRVSTEDSVVVETLRNAGAVIYVKTTMPQTGMAIETVSNLWGRTLNPANLSLVAGGSSGGEGALIACRGSLLGIGTDSGGSIRVPAAFNGLYSIKPTSRRVSYKGNNNNASGLGVSSSIGPMAHSVRDLKLIMKTLIDAEHWLKDAAIVQKPWDPPSAMQRKLRIGLLDWDGFVMPHPPIRRALKTVKAKLLAAGHEVIPIGPNKHHTYAVELVARVASQLGSGFMRTELEKTGEPPIKGIVPKFNREQLSLEEVVQVQKDWKAFREDYLEFWCQTALSTHENKPMDVLLSPNCGSASFPHDFVPSLNYSAIYNILDYPSITLPVTVADKELDQKDAAYQPVNEEDKKNFEMYDPELFDGAPVGLQLVGLPFTDEKLLEIGAVVDEAIHGLKQIREGL